MGRPGLFELLIILGVILILFGARRLPELGRSLGRAIREFKRAGKDSNEDASKTPHQRTNET